MKSRTHGTSAYQPTLHGAFAKRRISRAGLERFFCRYGGTTMPGVKQASKRKRVAKAVPALGAAGLTFSLVGGASASAVPTSDVPRTPNIAPSYEITLGEEEISDVSLATFYVFDKENTGTLQGLVQEARGCGGCRGCGGGRGCGGCRGCRGGVGVGCRGCGVGVGCRGCGVGWGVGWGVACGGCCASWGACRFC
jgi:hypothetical protein